MKPSYEELEQQLAESQSKLAQMAAENSTIKVMNDCLSEELRGYESDGAFDGPKMHLLWWKTETPATDAFLAEVRASELDSLSGVAETMLVKLSNQQCSSDMHEVVGWKMVLQQVSQRAALLRKGVQS
ncbi:hypothetical protein [Huaxiibacter chinensis]|uniref:hypothetical protein n=1 Tax=Huaxiibacter chinensis TaxID=2899785 RepID=UPI003D31331A